MQVPSVSPTDDAAIYLYRTRPSCRVHDKRGRSMELQGWSGLSRRWKWAIGISAGFVGALLAFGYSGMYMIGGTLSNLLGSVGR